MQSIISVKGLNKIYASGFQALKNVDLDIHRSEIFALLGPNGAGKTTLISAICGIVNPTSGEILADGHHIISDFRAARSKIGLVPQEIATELFETVWRTVTFSRGLYGKPRNDDLIEKIFKRPFSMGKERCINHVFIRWNEKTSYDRQGALSRTYYLIP